jgi:hypothetical protein
MNHRLHDNDCSSDGIEDPIRELSRSADSDRAEDFRVHLWKGLHAIHGLVKFLQESRPQTLLLFFIIVHDLIKIVFCRFKNDDSYNFLFFRMSLSTSSSGRAPISPRL